MSFGEKTVEELGEWLKMEGFGENTVKTFAGEFHVAILNIILKYTDVTQRCELE